MSDTKESKNTEKVKNKKMNKLPTVTNQVLEKGKLIEEHFKNAEIKEKPPKELSDKKIKYIKDVQVKIKKKDKKMATLLETFQNDDISDLEKVNAV